MARWVARQTSRSIRFRPQTRTFAITTEECYLRDDIPCGSAACISSCVQAAPPLAENATHYLIPDADMLWEFLEVFELPQVTGVILLTTVVKEIYRRSNPRKSSRIRSLYTDPRRCCHLFDDEHCLFTHLMGEDTAAALQKEQTGASAKEKDMAAAVHSAAAWYLDHLHHQIPVVIITDSTNNLPSPGVEVLTTSAYFAHYWSDDPTVLELYDSLAQAREAAAEEAQAKGSEGVTGGGGGVYRRHLSARELEEGIASGNLRVGVFQSSRLSNAEAMVRPCSKGEASRSDIFIPGRVLQNRALHGDTVVVRHLPRPQWRAPKAVTARASDAAATLDGGVGSQEEETALELEQGDVTEDDEAGGGDKRAAALTGGASPGGGIGDGGDSALSGEGDGGGRTGSGMEADSAPLSEPLREISEGRGVGVVSEGSEGVSESVVLTGEVVGILQRAPQEFVACLHPEDENKLKEATGGRKEGVLAVPMSRKLPFVRLRTRQAAKLGGQRFVVRIDGWERTMQFPLGHVVRIVGPIGDLQSESQCLLVEHGIDVAPFSAGALRELPQHSLDHPWVLPPMEVAARRDIRDDHRCCSIDPPGSKDVDDVLSVKWLPDGKAEVGVHIADVSFFVRHGGVLDLEARARGTTVYLVDRRFDMLPAILSEDLCSLIGGRDRLAVSVIWEVDPRGSTTERTLGKPWFGRTVIRSRHQLTYPQAQAILDGHDLPEDSELAGGPKERSLLRHDLSLLADLSSALRQQRQAAGALELESAELRFVTDAATGKPTRVQTKQELFVNGMVAELMIAANSAVAERIVAAFPSAALLRHHPPPRADGFDRLDECLAARGLPQVDIASNWALARSLDRLAAVDPTAQSALRAMATRAMAEAQYFCTGLASHASSFYHFGLALEFYTHFTSPIRRYADVLVHRMLILALDTDRSMRRDADHLTALQADRRAAHQIGRLSQPATSSLRQPASPVMNPSELGEVADHLNERHRASKLAQRSCSELYLLTYLQRHPQPEQAIVVSIHAHGVMVFVPKYDLRGPVHLRDKNGRILLPLTDSDPAPPTGSSDTITSPPMRSSDPLPSCPTGLVLHTEPHSLEVVDMVTGRRVMDLRLMQTVWVELRADASRAHAPALRIRLLADTHPAVLAAMTTAAETSFMSRWGSSFAPTSGPQSRREAVQVMAAEASMARGSGQAIQLDNDTRGRSEAQRTTSHGPHGRHSGAGGVAPRQQSVAGGVQQSVHDLVEEFRSLSLSGPQGYFKGTESGSPINASSIATAGGESPAVVAHLSDPSGGYDANGRGLSVGGAALSEELTVSTIVSSPPIDVVADSRLNERQRKWLAHLATAARARAKLLWSTLADDCERQQHRRSREASARRQGRLAAV